ncbi:hypothetical protein D1818_00940 [Aquimarina sp. BL5]|uniref:tetratricopeptide repeat protein n=1 Tax=Aquimarina sp. BL5 TaxID=1714860 RepID=UPI000E4B7C67|nr:hypothetical protein [Aquimarina sp. BL5]AXT49452.1 hypothetical protein D1818_00940 [Aquimarina sp. BL5]RKM98413.1 hypothetical protein D7036_20100 [Aquimarina sp. BL5]
MNIFKKHFSKTNAKHLFKLGHEEYKKGKIDNAIKLYTKAIEKFNDHIPSLYSRGSLYIDIFQWDKALADLEKVYKLDSKAYNIHFLLGVCQCSTGNEKIGIENLKKQIELTPKSPDLYWNMAIFNLRNEKYDLAFKDINTALEITPKNPYLHSIKGKILEKKGLIDKAEESYLIGANLEKKSGDSTGKLKEFYKRTDNITGCIKMIEKILEAFPYEPEILNEGGDLYRIKGDLVKAKEYYERAKNAGWENANEKLLKINSQE